MRRIAETTIGAEREFRPFLNKIKFHEPSGGRQLIFNGSIDDYCPFLDSLKKTVKVYVFIENLVEDKLGYGIFRYYGKNRCKFIILLSPRLFPGGEYDSPELRKVVGTHEYVHAIASVLNTLKIKNEVQLKKLMKKLEQKLNQDLITAQVIDDIIRKKGPEHLMYSTDGSVHPRNIIYDDEHFRPEGDLSTINYKKLFELLLFSKADFERYIEADNLPALKARTKNDLEGAYRDTLQQYKDIIANEMYLYEDFVVQRIKEILCTYLWE